MMTLALAHQLLPTSKLVGDSSITFNRVHTDTRSLQTGDLFVALKGESFDAHDFLNQVVAAGAVAAGASSFVKLEDVASADADAGVPAMAIRKATPPTLWRPSLAVPPKWLARWRRWF